MKRPVHDERAEQSVLGALLHNPAAFSDINGLQAEHFYRPVHELIFNTLLQMHNAGEQIDAITVFAKLEENRDLQRVGGAPYLADLLQAFKSADNIAGYARIVHDKWKIRRVNELGQRYLSVAESVDDIPQMLEEARKFLDAMDSHDSTSSLGFQDLYEEWEQWMEDDTPAIETPWPALNELLSGGLHRQRLYVIGARPGAGKSLSGLQMALYAAQLHHGVLVHSLEMPRYEVMARLLACGAQVDYGQITRRSLEAENFRKIQRWKSASSSLRLTVDDTPDYSIEQIAQVARAHKQIHGLDVLLIDYAQLVRASDRSSSREQQVSHIARYAKILSRKLDCVVILLAQLNRQVEESQGRARLPRKADLRESGDLENSADVILLLSPAMTESGFPDAHAPKIDVVVAKNRTGQERNIQLVKRFDQQRLVG